MRFILNVITAPDPLMEGVLALEQGNPDLQVETFVLTDKPDYRELLQKIFEADGVHVW